MKVIDIYDKIAKGEKIPTFIVDDDRYKYFMKDGFLHFNKLGYREEEVEWSVYKDWLNREITIVDDEFIDIEELKIGHPEDNPSNKYIINEYGTKCFLTKHSRIMAERINDLIKNQKKIINKLNLRDF